MKEQEKYISKIANVVIEFVHHIRNRYVKLVDRLEKRVRNKFLAFIIILLSLLLISWGVSWSLSWLPAWNSNIDSIEKFLRIPAWKIVIAACRICLAVFFVILYLEASLPFWREHPVERDRSLFTRSGLGMAVYSFGCILLVVSILITVTNLLKANTVFPPEPEFRLDYPREFGIIKRSWDVICQFVDPGNIHSSTNLQGNIIALLSALAGVLCLSGLAVSALVSIIARRTQQWKAGLKHYKYGFKNYVVIIGSNEQTATIIKKCLKEPGVQYVLIQTRKDVEKERAKLELRLERNDEERVVFYYGDRTLDEDINDLRLENAWEVYILGEDLHTEDEQDHDAYNVACLELISKYMKSHARVVDKDKRLRCHVSFEYQSTFMVFKFTHIYRSLNEKVEFLPFNVHEIWAKKVLVDNFAIIPTGKHSEMKVQRYLPVDMYRTKDKEGNWVENYIQYDSQQRVHVVVIGMNQMGVAMAMQTALLVHLPNFQTNSRRRTTITFIDDNAGKEGEYLRSRYDALFSLCRYRTISRAEISLCEDTLENGKDDGWINPLNRGDYSFMRENQNDENENFMDLQWEFIEDNVASDRVRDYLSSLTADRANRTVSIAVCFNNPQQSIATALYLPETVFKNALQVLVYQKNSFDLIDKVANTEKEWKRYEKLRPFGMIEGCYTGNVFDNMQAKLANWMYYDKKEEISVDAITSAQIYRAHRLWEELGIVDKYANIDLVDSFEMKLRSLGNDEEEQSVSINEDGDKIKNLAKAEHLRWLTERLTMGFRPLDREELKNYEDFGDKGYEYSKDYYKNKSRAHPDICSIEDVAKRDPQTANRDMDGKLIRNLLNLRRWSQQAILNNLIGEDSLVRNILRDMKYLPEKKINIGKHPVTIEQWETIMGYLPVGLQNVNKTEPVTCVSWEDVQDFLVVLRKETGLPFDLPKQDEWNAAKKCNEVENMEHGVWQWTKSDGEEYESSKIFCGKSKKFSKFELDHSYWLPNFTSDDLGFRLILRYDMSIDVSGNDKKAHEKLLEEIRIDDSKVIYSIVRKMVKIEINEKESFWIMPTPVTQRHWKAVMYEGKAPGEKKNPSIHRGDYYPIENITFKQAEEFAGKLRDKFGVEFRLPTNAEWQYAASLKDQEHITIDEKDKNKESRIRTIWHKGIAKSTHEVPNYNELSDKPDRYLVYDMLGNVWEWCDDRPAYEGPDSDICRVMQGGSFRFTEMECKGIDKSGSYWLKENYRADDVGFRIVVSDEEYQKLQMSLDNRK